MKLILVGGFLGSGKTTAIYQACSELFQHDIKAGVITNDQGEQLVDSGFIQGKDIPFAEVTNGCFCCKYNDLDQCIQTLSTTCRPQMIFAESVGSCTDLIATVVHPMLMFYPSLKVIVCVFADANLLLQQMQERHLYDESVQYIYQKQLDEADVLVVNKIDLLNEEQLEKVIELVEAKYPSKHILYQNSLSKSGVQQWVNILRDDFADKKRKPLEIDYDIYATGEEKLAWLDQYLELITNHNDAYSQAVELVKSIHRKILDLNWPIGHLKFLFSDGDHKLKISFTGTNTYGFDIPGYLSGNKLEILLNARVQADPVHLEAAIADCVQSWQEQHACIIIKKQSSAFKPGYPKPVYRMPG